MDQNPDYKSTMVHTPLGPRSSIRVLRPEKKTENKVNMSYLDLGKESEPYYIFVLAINTEQSRTEYFARIKKFL